jgi:hypothetical protein
MIILPRQARDKHRESTHKKGSGVVLQFYPFLIGAAQLCGHDSLRPSSIGDSRLLEEHYEDCALRATALTKYRCRRLAVSD